MSYRRLNLDTYFSGPDCARAAPLAPRAPALQVLGRGPAPGAPYPLARAATACLVVLGLLFARRPEAFLHPQFFAEDGPIFFMGAYQHPWASIVTPYAGYLHVGLRLVATACSVLDPLWVPTAYLAASTAAVAALVTALFSRRLRLPCPWAFALCLPLVPHTGEVFDTLTNLQWLGALGIVLLLLAPDPDTRGLCALDFGFAAVASVTGVFSIVFAPLFLVRAWRRRSRASAGLLAVVLIGGAVQAYLILHTPWPQAGPPASPAAMLSTFGHRAFLALFVPARAFDGLPRALGLPAAASALGLLGLLAMPGRGSRLRRLLASLAIPLLSAAAIYKVRGSLEILGPLHNGDRYFFVPKVCLLWMLCFHLRRASPLRGTCALLLAVALAATLAGFRFEHWENLDWPRWAQRMRAEPVVAVPINPAGFSFVYARPDGAGR